MHKISMCTYLKKLTNISQKYEYIEIHVINIYDTKTWESMLCHTILMQCFSEFIMNIYQYKFYFIRFIILTNSTDRRNK